MGWLDLFECSSNHGASRTWQSPKTHGWRGLLLSLPTLFCLIAYINASACNSLDLSAVESYNLRTPRSFEFPGLVISCMTRMAQFGSTSRCYVQQILVCLTQWVHSLASSSCQYNPSSNDQIGRSPFCRQFGDRVVPRRMIEFSPIKEPYVPYVRVAH